MNSRNHNPMTCDAECPNCRTWQRVDRDEDGAPDLPTQPCHADDCTKRLCENCPQFVCTGCDLAHCAEHLTRYGLEEFCPLCMKLTLGEAKAKGLEIGVIS